MARPDRLFRLLHLLRTLPPPVTAARLAEETGVSERTLYRDIDSLRAAGALIDGEAGFGYRLTEDPAVPPQMFDRLEVEALVLGLAEVQATGDGALAEAAGAALAKITARLPERVAQQVAHSVTLVYRYESGRRASELLAPLRQASWDEVAVDIAYRDAEGRRTRRRIWPLAVAFLEQRQLVLSWCCLRQDYRKFDPERMEGLEVTTDSFRPHRVSMLRDYVERLRRGG
ncbi:YafY family protein [Pseudoruegeria sp. HB172150]|uniref:helix-turn-helix transcriptional regulator n=1 Tax=Pseudoruegeria sp. HB172150 TaxID=2721164 RepID=UPI001555753F|nr:HTH domain-containing protein [Pseudoruegeria sp. HB172150]